MKKQIMLKKELLRKSIDDKKIVIQKQLSEDLKNKFSALSSLKKKKEEAKKVEDEKHQDTV